MSDNLQNDLAERARAELDPLADLVESTFAELSRSLTDELARASFEGRRSIADLADGVLEELARIGAERFVEKPLTDAFRDPASNPFLGSLMKRIGRNG